MKVIHHFYLAQPVHVFIVTYSLLCTLDALAVPVEKYTIRENAKSPVQWLQFFRFPRELLLSFSHFFFFVSFVLSLLSSLLLSLFYSMLFFKIVFRFFFSTLVRMCTEANAVAFHYGFSLHVFFDDTHGLTELLHHGSCQKGQLESSIFELLLFPHFFHSFFVAFSPSTLKIKLSCAVIHFIWVEGL